MCAIMCKGFIVLNLHAQNALVIQKLKMPDARRRTQRNSIVSFEIPFQYASRSRTVRKKALINLACSCSICIEFTKIEN